jgi:hypothetical protein
VGGGEMTMICQGYAATEEEEQSQGGGGGGERMLLMIMYQGNGHACMV